MSAISRFGFTHPHLPAFIGLSTLLLCLGLSATSLWRARLSPTPSAPVIADSEPAVLGNWYQPEPAIVISGPDTYGANGGVIALASTDEPAVTIESYSVSGDVTVKLYPATEAQLFAYLTHNDENKQVSPQVTPNGSPITEFTYTLPNQNQDGTPLNLPLAESGLYHLNIGNGSVTADAFIIRSQTGVLVKEGDNQFVFWGQDYATKRSLNQGTLRFLSVKNQVTDLSTAAFNDTGIATTPIVQAADFAWISRGDDRALVPLNLKYLNSRYQSLTYTEKFRQVTRFVFTDRPLYQPGDTVYFKAVIRDDDDARYTLPATPVKVTVSTGWGDERQVIYDESHSPNNFGSIDGQFTLPSTVKTGYYQISLDPGPTGRPENYYGDYSGYYNSAASFQVDYFRKPDYFLTVSADKNEYIAGDTITYTLQGQYFSGQPLANQDVTYTLRTSAWGDYDYYADAAILTNDFMYGWYGSTELNQSRVRLNDQGQAIVKLPAKNHDGKSQIYSLNAKLVGTTGTSDEAFKNVAVYSGEFGLYRADYAYGFNINEPLSLPLKAVTRVNQSVANLPLNVQAVRSWYEKQPLAEGEKYPHYDRKTESLPGQTLTTDAAGAASINFTPQSGGNYEFTVTSEDARGNRIVKTTSAWVSDTYRPVYFNENRQGLDLSVNTKLAEPGGTVRLTLISDIPDRDVFLGFERGYLNRFQILHLNGTSATETLALTQTDMPNIFLTASSFSTDWLDSVSLNLPVNPAQKQLVVKLTPDQAQYGPGDTVNLSINTQTKLGQPVSAELAVWAVDKAIFELVDQSNLDIFQAFWHERNDTTPEDHSLEGITALTAEGGGCFTGDTPILMADGSLKPISDVSATDAILTRTSASDPTLVPATVTSTHRVEDTGYLTINGTLKVTVNHQLWVNDAFTEAGSIQIGDRLIDRYNRPVVVDSIAYHRLKVPVYNLEIDRYHTFFAGGVWVHNQKGESRAVFKDTAYWNPRVVTDSQGQAQLSFKLPDNLTTWTVAGVGASIDTVAGDAKQDLIVTKDIVLRPVLPNLLRSGDQAVIRTMLHNFSDQEHTFSVSLDFDAGDVESATRSGLILKANDFAQIEFPVKPNRVADQAKFTFTALAADNPKIGDSITQTLPVQPFGFTDARGGASAQGNHDYLLTPPGQFDPSRSSINLHLTPTLLGTLPQAMTYLLGYPYGCVEQTTSRFVPLVIAAANPSLFASVLKDVDTQDLVKKGLERLAALQNADGGWGWWSEGQSSPFISAYVIEYLIAAQVAGFETPPSLLDRATGYLNQLPASPENTVSKAYAQAFLSADRDKTALSDFNAYPPDLLAWAVMTNIKNGHTDPNLNGAKVLLSQAAVQGDAVSWSAGDKSHFGSIDASTALAVRALTLANLKSDAYKGVLYLNRSRVKPYWSNTFATGQVAHALVTYGQSGSELTPNYTYAVTLDGQTLKTGQVTNRSQVIPPLSVPSSDLSAPSSLAVTITGTGELYSTLIPSWYLTDPHSPPVSDGLTLTRAYINDKDPSYTLGVGDTATIKLTVTNPGSELSYAVIEDELPAGLIPINTNFKNEQENLEPQNYVSGVWGQEITQNGAVISLGRLPAGQTTYTYKARVLAEGAYQTPPARIHLMYAPEIYARSGAETIVIDKAAVFDPARAVKQINQASSKSSLWLWLGLSAAGLLILGVGVFLFIRYRRRHPKTPSIPENPLPPPPASPPPPAPAL